MAYFEIEVDSVKDLVKIAKTRSQQLFIDELVSLGNSKLWFALMGDGTALVYSCTADDADIEKELAFHCEVGDLVKPIKASFMEVDR